MRNGSRMRTLFTPDDWFNSAEPERFLSRAPSYTACSLLEPVQSTDARLTVVAPENLWETLGAALKPLYSLVELLPRMQDQSGRDPYGLAALADRIHPDGIVLVAPRRRAPKRLLTAPVLHGIPVGIVHADEPEQLLPWLRALRQTASPVSEPTWAALAMGKNYYLDWGERFFAWMQKAQPSGLKVECWLADTVDRAELCHSLAAGPLLAIYTGHGRARGWSGYQALRWEHLAAKPLQRACGVVIGLACDTLKRTRNVFPFGCRWISEGRASAYFGSTGAVRSEWNAALAQIVGEQLATGRFQTIGALLKRVNVIVHQPDQAHARQAFLSYRLMGNPLQSLLPPKRSMIDEQRPLRPRTKTVTLA